MKNKIIRIATRTSSLALWQSNWVKSAIEKKYPDCRVILHKLLTQGDEQQNIALSQLGGKSLFVKALQHALLIDEADIAVHSIKDMSAHSVPGLALAAICRREDSRDAFVSEKYAHPQELPKNAVIGTASPRRTCFIKSLLPGCEIKLLRGNVDTRVSKMLSGEYDAIVLAAAGLKRLQLEHHIRFYFPSHQFVPAIGQGAIGIECKENDEILRNSLAFLNHMPTEYTVRAEKAVSVTLNADCHAPLGVHARIEKGIMRIMAAIGSMDGKMLLRCKMKNIAIHPEMLGEAVAHNLLTQGAARFLSGEFHA